MAGKGDKPRTLNTPEWRENYDAVFGKKERDIPDFPPEQLEGEKAFYGKLHRRRMSDKRARWLRNR